MVPLPERVDVLVVGAGPTGMTAALSLHKHGCTDILIVDGVIAGENTSRAMAVHAATMEVRSSPFWGLGEVLKLIML